MLLAAAGYRQTCCLHPIVDDLPCLPMPVMLHGLHSKPCSAGFLQHDFNSRSQSKAACMCRRIIDHFNSKFVPLFYRVLVRQDEAQQQEVAKQIQDQLRWLEQHVDSKGPFFVGQEFSMVDTALLPWFIRMFILEHYRGFGVPKDCKKLAAWSERATKRQSVQETFTGAAGSEASYEDQLLEHYSRYADASANSTSAHDFK